MIDQLHDHQVRSPCVCVSMCVGDPPPSKHTQTKTHKLTFGLGVIRSSERSGEWAVNATDILILREVTKRPQKEG